MGLPARSLPLHVLHVWLIKASLFFQLQTCAGYWCPLPLLSPRRFFELYNNHVAPNLYDRLQFVIVVQDWEAMSNTFWLKTALVGAGRALHRVSSCSAGYIWIRCR